MHHLVRIKLPRFHAVAVIVLKLVMKVVVALPKVNQAIKRCPGPNIERNKAGDPRYGRGN